MFKKQAKTPLSKLLNFSGKNVLITGAAAGMGRATAERFAEAGSSLILIDIDTKRLNEVRSSLPECDSSTYIIDLADKASIDNFWENLSTNDLPDILINNAGIFPSQVFTKIDQAYWQKIMDINLNSIVWMCQNFIKRRGKRGGVIVNISSIEAVLPFKDEMVHYAVSKAGILALTRSLARDYGRKGYKINAIIPGGVSTPGTNELALKALSKIELGLIKTSYDFNQRLPVGRVGQSDDIAKVVLFLSSELSSYVQGVCLPVDGGFLSS